jgi:hypothetical protein
MTAKQLLKSATAQEEHPSGLKPASFCGSCGTTKVVPFQNCDSRGLFQQAVKPCPLKNGGGVCNLANEI